MRIDREWSMPNKWTFTIEPIRKLLEEEVGKGEWADPFAGMNSPASITNDLSPDARSTHHMDALQFLQDLGDESLDGVLLDPPYSIGQAKECYEGRGMELLDTKPTSMKYWADCKNNIARILRPHGKAICFGWTSMGLGSGRGFKMERILLVPHGGSRNDTIVTVERKLDLPNLFRVSE